MKIFMVRHGETESNAAKRIQGQRIDESLNGEGVRQAKALSEKIGEMRFDVIFCSPLKRAHETATILAGDTHLPVILRDELMERDFGSLSGKTWDQVESAETLRALDKVQKYDYRPLGGESAEDVKTRFQKIIAEIKNLYAGKKVLIVAHAGILRLAHMLFRETAVGHIKNAEVEEFEI